MTAGTSPSSSNPTLLFVHGTGVRGAQYVETLTAIKKQIALHSIAADLRGCFWGDAEGAKLHAGGASIPRYAATGGGVDEEEVRLALWAVLYTDPWYELRLLRHLPTRQETVLGIEAPPVLLRRAIEKFEPSDALLRQLDDASLVAEFFHARRELLDAPEFEQAAATAPADPLEHRRAIARALIAHGIVATTAAGRPIPDGALRDALVERVSGELHGYGLDISDQVRHPIRGLAMYYATYRLTRDRGAISDATAPMAGDILRFLAHGDGARRFVRQSITDLPGDVYLLAHSLGGIICVDLLIRESIPQIRGLITVGSQAPLLYEIHALPSLIHPEPLPDLMPPWLNIYDPRDLLSYLGAGLFNGRVTDVVVDNGQPFPAAHSAYWTNRELWKAVARFLQ